MKLKDKIWELFGCNKPDVPDQHISICESCPVYYECQEKEIEAIRKLQEQLETYMSESQKYYTNNTDKLT